MKVLRIDCTNVPGGGQLMTGIRVEIDEGDDFEIAKAKALGHIVTELSRYGLHEALAAVGIKPQS
jgi:hypothetical protein